MYKCFLETEKTLLNPKGGCMKKLLAVLVVLSIASVANAGLTIGGVPTGPLMPSDEVILQIVGDGQEASAFDAYFVIQGPATVSGGALVYTYGLSAYGLYTMDETYVPWMQGIFNDPTIMQVGDVTFASTNVPVDPLSGVLLDALVFHCDALGDVTISLVTMDGEGAAIATLWDTVVIHQIPEPMTLGLLGLGGLFLRRRK
jgi:hypothetical protein